MKRCISLSILSIMIMIFLSCKVKLYEEAGIIVSKMTLDEKIGQMIMVGVPGSTITDRSRNIFKKHLPGGIILFGFNLSEKDKTGQFIEDLQKTSMKYSGLPLFISIDQEGGRVRRIYDGVTQYPGNMAFGVVDDEDIVFDSARIVGMQLRLIGVNINLAPVMDVNNNPGNPVINTRSYGSSPDLVSRLGVSYIKGLQRSKCISVAKHFPGHGDTNKDSHITLPVINYDMERLKRVELKPFMEAIDSDVEAIMTAHIAYPEILKNSFPATVSKAFLNGILRKELEFGGLIITDDMEMDAISKYMDIGEAAVRSIDAGADIILISSYGDDIPVIIHAMKRAVKTGILKEKRIVQSVVRIIELKLRYGIMGFINGKITLPKMSYGKKEIKLLSEAEVINKRVSRDSIYYYGEDYSVFKGVGAGDLYPVFITTNRTLIECLRAGMKSYRVFRNINGFMNYYNTLNKKNYPSDFEADGIIVFYHIEKLKKGRFNRIVDYASKNSLRIFILSTGNPFELTGLESLPPSLFTFSNTVESIRGMVDCIKGEFKPRTEIKIDLGFKK